MTNPETTAKDEAGERGRGGGGQSAPRRYRASLALNALLLVVLAAVAVTFAARRWGRGTRWGATGADGRRMDVYTRERESQLSALPRREGATVMLGDSLTERGEWTELLGDGTIQNRGIAGNTTIDVLARAGEVAAGKPARVFLLVGVNDLAAGDEAEGIARRYGEILDALRAGAPGVKLYCVGVFPVREGESQEGVTNERIRRLNEAIAKVAAGRSCRVVDVGARLAGPDGALDAAVTIDGVHLTGAGYAKWAEALAEELTREGR